MTFYLIAVVAVGVVAGVIVLRRWLHIRRNLDQLLDMDWWQQPLARLAIHLWIRSAWQALDDYCGFVKTVDGKKVSTRAAWRSIFVSKQDGRWRIKIVVTRRFDQGNEETDDVRNAKQKVVNQAVGVFGLGEYTATWDFWWWRHHVVLTPKQVIPKVARFETPDYHDLIVTALTKCATAPVIAIGRGDQPIAIDMDTEAPHFLISAGTIGGKSVTIRNIVAQMLWADDQAIAVIVDTKEHSQRGLAAVPGVVVAREAEEVNGALVAVWEEVQRRNRICRDIPLGQELPRFPRILLALEEMNAAEKVLKDWWRQRSGVRAGMPPGIYALTNILCQGRAVRTNVVLVAQQANVQSAGGGEGRVNIAVRILAEYGESEWKMLAHGADYIPAVSHKVQKGWCVVVHGRDVQEGQRILMTDEEAHGWLTGTGTNGTRARVLEETFPSIGGGEVPADQRHTPADDAGYDHPLRGIGPQQEQAVGDEEKHEQAVTDVGHRSASQQPAEAPVGEHGHGHQSPQQQGSTDPDDRDQHGDGVGGDGQGGGFHAPIIQHSSYDGKGNMPPDQGIFTDHPAPGNTNPPPAGSAPSAPTLSPTTPLAPPTNHVVPPSGLVVSPARHVSTLAISGGNGIGANDTEDVYATLREMWGDDGEVRRLIPSLVALRKAAQDPRFPAAVPMPGGHEYSRRATREFLAGRASRRRSRPTRGFIYALVGGGRPTLYELLATGNEMGQVKIGYTSRTGPIRAKEIAPYRPEHIVKQFEVPHPPDGERLPDKAWHERFHEWAVDRDDPTCELFWIRGEVARWLGVREEVSA